MNEAWLMKYSLIIFTWAAGTKFPNKHNRFVVYFEKLANFRRNMSISWLAAKQQIPQLSSKFREPRKAVVLTYQSETGG